MGSPCPSCGNVNPADAQYCNLCKKVFRQRHASQSKPLAGVSAATLAPGADGASTPRASTPAAPPPSADREPGATSAASSAAPGPPPARIPEAPYGMPWGWIAGAAGAALVVGLVLWFALAGKGEQGPAHRPPQPGPPGDYPYVAMRAYLDPSWQKEGDEEHHFEVMQFYVTYLTKGYDPPKYFMALASMDAGERAERFRSDAGLLEMTEVAAQSMLTGPFRAFVAAVGGCEMVELVERRFARCTGSALDDSPGDDSAGTMVVTTWLDGTVFYYVMILARAERQAVIDEGTAIAAWLQPI